ncbi:calcium voltage-gated channel auxiliary subunit beta 1 [Phyllostomus discolor]|uniref:Calcium voltage-gated channel auxiliary subunit beta 1 n=1 Tax=Phyllostomus discolor TaxID=89673 RepID=A0A834DU02_9CHIR|nr:calcium voltage-gated channel auxiliary subunit beta 1 [Phyllostomus discolor]
MVQKTSMSRGPYPPSQEIPMEVFDPSPQGKYSKRKGRFKRSDGSRSGRDLGGNGGIRCSAICPLQALTLRSGRPEMLLPPPPPPCLSLHLPQE